MLDALAAANPFTDNWLGYAPKLRRIFRCLFTTVSTTLMALLRLLPKAKDVRSGQEMRLHDWLKQSKFSVKRFAREVQVERAMVYRYFAGAVPRVSTIRRIEAITKGAVVARDFYDNAMQRRLDVSASGEWSGCGKPSPHPPKPESDEATAQERGYDEVSRLAS